MPEENGVLAVAEELYGLPLDEFIPSRDAKAKELKGSDDAGPVKKLKKPSTAAWVVNLLVRRETEQVEQMLKVGRALRDAQEGMDADQLRELTKQRRQLTAAITTRARALAREHGYKVTDAVAEQVEATLTAAMIDEDAGKAVRSGLLTGTLSATGVGDVGAREAVALSDALGFEAAPVEDEPVALHLVPDLEPDETARREAQEALATAKADVETAHTKQQQAAEEVQRLQARGLQLQAEIDELRGKLVDLESIAQQVDDELGTAEDVRDDADAALAEAQQARDAAEAEVARWP